MERGVQSVIPFSYILVRIGGMGALVGKINGGVEG